jgi:Tfp pilus assembly protein PilF
MMKKMMMKKREKWIPVVTLWGVMALLFSGCAEMTEPDVRAYIHEKHAYAEIRQGQLDKAEQDLKQALRDNPREPSILNNMAYIAFRKGQTMKAVGYLEQARVLKTDDNDEPYILNEARILIAHPDYRRALSLLALIEPRHNWPSGYRKLMAEALLHNGQSSHALAVLLGKHETGGDMAQP